ncbi:MAG: hypothetical protein KDC87_08855, partial [Planctomycetes bacterium]|nr:hypothetical protein [Planctomycetota bacterium]
MVFSSHAFLFWFLPVFLAGYFALPRHARNPWLTGMSYLFFGWFRPQYTVLMLVSTAIDYLCARGMGERGGQVSASRRRLLLWCSLAANLGLLGYFKYANL